MNPNLLQRTMLSSVDMKASEILETVLPLRDEVHRLTRIGRYFFLAQHSTGVSGGCIEIDYKV